MKLQIFTEGGSGIGLGHISRCSSLYDEAAGRGIEVEFIIYGDIENVDFLKGRTFKDQNWLSEDYLNNHINSKDYCIVDSYLASENLYSIISDRSKKALFIDDTARIEYPKGLVVNPCLNIEGIDYPSKNEVVYLLGAQYILLRRPFIGVERDVVNKDPKSVLITMGGSDIRDLTPKIMDTVCRIHPELKFYIVIGDGFHNVSTIESMKLDNVVLCYNLDAESMKRLMTESDYAITAAGQTTYELMATQTPFIPIQVVDNQLYNARGLVKYKLANQVISWDQIDFKENLLSCMSRMSTFEIRLELKAKYTRFIDGFGAKRIISELTGL